MIVQFILLVSSMMMPAAYGSVLLQLDETFSDCGKDSLKALDLSELSYDYVNDTTIVLNGNFKSLRRIDSPWKCRIYIEKYERGKWIIAVIDKKVDDFCKSIQKPTEVWYRFTSRLKHKNCPFPAGYVETFDNMRVGKLPDYFSYAVVGKYRFTFSSDLPNDSGELQNQCIRMGFEVVPE